MSDFIIPGMLSAQQQNMIDQNVKVQRKPIENLESKNDFIDDKIGSVRDLSSKISSLQDSAKKLYGVNDPFLQRKAISSKPSILDANALKRAELSKYEFKIDQIAKRDRFLSKELDNNKEIAEGNYGFKLGETEINIKYRGGSLKDFSDFLNRRSRGNLESKIIDNGNNKIFVLSSLKSGKENKIYFTTQDAINLGIEFDLIKKDDNLTTEIALNKDNIEALNQDPDSFSLDKENNTLTLKANAELSIKLDKEINITENTIIEMELALIKNKEKEQNEDDILPTPDYIELRGVKVSNIKDYMGSMDMVDNNEKQEEEKKYVALKYKNDIEDLPLLDSNLLKQNADGSTEIRGIKVAENTENIDEAVAENNTENIDEAKEDQETENIDEAENQNEGNQNKELNFYKYVAKAQDINLSAIDTLNISNPNSDMILKVKNIVLKEDIENKTQENEDIKQENNEETQDNENNIVNENIYKQYVAKNPIDQAQDAILDMEGVKITRDKNEIDDVISGVTLKLKKESDDPVELEIIADNDQIKDKIIELIATYNQTMQELNILTGRSNSFSKEDEEAKSQLINTAYFEDDQEKEDAFNRIGMFQGNSLLNSIKNQLKKIMTSSYDTKIGNQLSTLKDIGIATNLNSGSFTVESLFGYMQLDEDKLDDIISKNLDSLKDLFAMDGNEDLIMDQGLAYSVNTYINDYLKRPKSIENLINNLKRDKDKNDDKIDTYEQKLDKFKDDTKRQLLQLNQAQTQMKTNSDTLKNLMNINRQD